MNDLERIKQALALLPPGWGLMATARKVSDLLPDGSWADIESAIAGEICAGGNQTMTVWPAQTGGKAGGA